MREALVVSVVSAFLGVPAGGVPGEKVLPSGRESARVLVNSQKSLVEAIGDGFQDTAWEYPSGLVPRELPNLTYVSGPGDEGLGPKGAWRKPIIVKDEASGVMVSINCYRWRHDKRAPGGRPVTPAAPLLEPNYRYRPAEFHGLRAATASEEDREVFTFRDGDLLFKFEATGGRPDVRRRTPSAAAEGVWWFRHPGK